MHIGDKVRVKLGDKKYLPFEDGEIGRVTGFGITERDGEKVGKVTVQLRSGEVTLVGENAEARLEVVA